MAGGDQVFRGRVISVRLVSTPRGQREVVDHPGAVAVAVRNAAGKLLLVRQHRPGANRPLWEIPAGTLEPGERPLAAARRELAEETGLAADRLRYLGTIYPTPGYGAERIFLFAAQATGTAAPQAEIAAVGYFSSAEIVALARAGQGDGKTLAALTLLQLGEQGQEQPT
ncbi:MAG: NUDIX hydrolase [Candidatus Bipolaricaulaceae bacterium]